MEVSKKALVQAIEILKVSDKTDTKEALELINVLTTLAARSPYEYIDLFNRDEYFATILWQNEDVASCFKENTGRDATDEDMAEILNRISIGDMEDCSHGWDCIEDAVSSYLKEKCLEERED